VKKELPKMYQCKIDKNINTIQKTYSTLDRNNNVDNTSEIKNKELKKYDLYTVEQKIYNIFKSPTYIYKVDVEIVMDNEVLHKRVIGKNKDNLITIDNEYIPIYKIRDIYTK